MCAIDRKIREAVLEINKGEFKAVLETRRYFRSLKRGFKKQIVTPK